jgi:hypothetical protein
MRILRSILAGGAGLAALAAAGPAAAQYPYGYSYSPYSYSPYSSYGYSQYGYAGMNTTAAASQCTAAVQNRLYNRTSLGSILGSLVGLPMTSTARVLSVTQVTPLSYGRVRVRGLASSGRVAYNNYNPYGAYGYGAYGALGYNYAAAADLSFKCDVDARGYIRDVDINRRY